MDPRNKSKAPWTSLPEEFSFKVLSALEKEFPKQANSGEFIVEGKVFEQEIFIRIGYLEKGRIRQMNFEASIDYDRIKNDEIPEKNLASTGNNADILDNFYICIDCLGVWIKDTFKNIAHDENLDLPLTWRPTDFHGQTVFLKYSSVNSRLEQDADRLLGIESDTLFHESGTTEDAFDLAEVDPDLSSDHLNGDSTH